MKRIRKFKLPRNIIKNIRILVLVLVFITFFIGIAAFFYKYSEKSKATADEIPVKFSKTDIRLSSSSPDAYVEIYFEAGEKALSGATTLLSYPKDIITVESDPTVCNGFGENVISRVNSNTGTIILSRTINTSSSTTMPQGVICFARLNIHRIADGNGALTFLDGPLDQYIWEIIGGLNIYTPAYEGQSVSITVSDANVTPDPTATLTQTPTITLSPSPNPTISITPNSTPTLTQIPPTIPPSQPTHTPTPIISQTTKNIDISIRLQGVTNIPRSTADIPVMISFAIDEEIIDERKITFKVQSDGTWKGSSEYNILRTGVDYSIFIKGPKHIQKRICKLNPSEDAGGTYHCSDSTIRLAEGKNEFNFTGVVLLSGDLPEQNGIVDSQDITYIRSNVGSTTSEVLARADLNYDGIVDTQDYTLIINALSFKYDE